MPLSSAEVHDLQMLFAECEDQARKLTDWEIGYFTDQQKRVEQYAERTRFSQKQLDVIERIAKKVSFQWTAKPDPTDIE